MIDDRLSEAGLGWYEVSNWAATPEAACRHNLGYWLDGDWWGLGPGAHSHLAGARWWNVKHPARYAALLDANQSPAAGRETLDAVARLTERVMLGVRRREGLAVASLPEASREVLPQLVRWGLVDPARHTEGQLVLTQRGRLMADAVVKELLAVV